MYIDWWYKNGKCSGCRRIWKAGGWKGTRQKWGKGGKIYELYEL
jgi:hypothetical protein